GPAPSRGCSPRARTGRAALGLAHDPLSRPVAYWTFGVCPSTVPLSVHQKASASPMMLLRKPMIDASTNVPVEVWMGARPISTATSPDHHRCCRNAGDGGVPLAAGGGSAAVSGDGRSTVRLARRH